MIDKKGRILINDEYVTPDELLKNDPYFEEFRKNKPIKKTNENVTTSTMPDLTKFLKSENNKKVRKGTKDKKRHRRRTISEDS